MKFSFDNSSGYRIIVGFENLNNNNLSYKVTPHANLQLTNVHSSSWIHQIHCAIIKIRIYKLFQPWWYSSEMWELGGGSL